MSFTTTPVSDNANPVITATLPGTLKQETQISQTVSPAPSTEPPKKEEENFSERFAKLAKAQKQLQKEREQTKQLYAQAKLREEQLAQREIRLKDFESVKQQPLKALEMLGLDYNTLSQAVINNGNIPAEAQVQAVRREIEELKLQQQKEKEEAQRLAAINQEAEAQAILTQYQASIKSFTEANKDEFELINLFDQSSLVYNTIQEHFNKTGQVLSTKQACDLVEKELESTAVKMKGSKKFNKLFGLEEQQQTPVKTQSLSKTLSNNLTSSVPTSLPPHKEADRLARAMARLG